MGGTSMRDRAMQIWVDADGKMRSKDLLRQLRAEGHADVTPQMIYEWKRLDLWEDELKMQRAVGSGMGQLNRIMSAQTRDDDGLPQQARLSTTEEALGNSISCVTALADKIHEALAVIRVTEVAAVCALADAMSVAATVSIRLGEYIAIQRERSAKRVDATDENGNPVNGTIMAPAVRHGNVIEAIDAFKDATKRGQ